MGRSFAIGELIRTGRETYRIKQVEYLTGSNRVLLVCNMKTPFKYEIFKRS